MKMNDANMMMKQIRDDGCVQLASFVQIYTCHHLQMLKMLVVEVAVEHTFDAVELNNLHHLIFNHAE